MKARQDQAYPEHHIDEEDARPARSVHEGHGSVPLKMIVSCTHLGLYTQRKRPLKCFQRRRKNWLAHHLWDLKHSGGLNPADKDVWAYESDFEVVKQYF